MSKNDVTGDKIKTKNITENYRSNFDKIFKKAEPGYTGEVRKKPEEEKKDER